MSLHRLRLSRKLERALRYSLLIAKWARLLSQTASEKFHIETHHTFHFERAPN